MEEQILEAVQIDHTNLDNDLLNVIVDTLIKCIQKPERKCRHFRLGVAQQSQY